MFSRIPSSIFCIGAFLALVLMLSAGSALGAELRASDAPVSLSHAKPRAVRLTDARTAPDTLRYLKPGKSYTPHTYGDALTCKRGRHLDWYSDVSAYQWSGAPLGAQHWSERLTHGGGIGYYWSSPSGGRVEYDGLTFYNGTRAPVIVAGWCA